MADRVRCKVEAYDFETAVGLQFGGHDGLRKLSADRYRVEDAGVDMIRVPSATGEFDEGRIGMPDASM